MELRYETLKDMQATIIIADASKNLRDTISMYLENNLDATVYQADSASGALKLIADIPHIHLIISEQNLASGTGSEILASIRQTQQKIPFVLCCSQPPDQIPAFKNTPPDDFILKPSIDQGLHKIIGNVHSGKYQIQIRSRLFNHEPFVKVKPRILHILDKLPTDIYVKLQADKFLKAAHKGDSFTEDDVAKFALKNVDYLYIVAKESDLFFQTTLQKIQEVAEPAPLEDAFLLSSAMQESIQKIATVMGVTPELERLIAANTKTTLSVIQKNPSLKSFFTKISIDPDNYIITHSAAIAYVACGIAKALDWHSEHTYSKLTIAAFLHDVGLDNPELAKCRTDIEFAAHKPPFSHAEHTIWREHSTKAADLIRTMHDIPPDVDHIVAQHHERPDGSGFPLGLDYHRISPLAALFIVAHDLSHCLHHDEAHLQNFITSQEKEYNKGFFKKIYLALQTLEQ